MLRIKFGLEDNYIVHSLIYLLSNSADFKLTYKFTKQKSKIRTTIEWVHFCHESHKIEKLLRAVKIVSDHCYDDKKKPAKSVWFSFKQILISCLIVKKKVVLYLFIYYYQNKCQSS